jgi:hypothetical protein
MKSGKETVRPKEREKNESRIHTWDVQNDNVSCTHSSSRHTWGTETQRERIGLLLR